MEKRFYLPKTKWFFRIKIDNVRYLPVRHDSCGNREFWKTLNLSSAQAWFGLVNQVAWAYSISPVMQPFRTLIKPSSKFQWDETLDKAFEMSKGKLIELIHKGVRTYDLKKYTSVQNDWSRQRVGIWFYKRIAIVL